MRSLVVIAVMAGLVMSCAEAPTQTGTVGATSASFARAPGDPRPGAIIVRFDGREFQLPVPPVGMCTFASDNAGNLNNFIRTNPDGTTSLKLNDQSGTITVQLVSGHTWVGRGRIDLNWPDYRSNIDTADNFDVTIVGTVSEGAATAHVVCKNVIAHGYDIERYLKLN